MILDLHPTRTLTLRDAPPRGATLDEQLAHVLREIDDEVSEAHKEVARSILTALERTVEVCRALGISADDADTTIEHPAFVLILAETMFRAMLDMFGPEGQVLS